MTTKDKVYIFSCGTQYLDWVASNCQRCEKSVEVWGNPTDCYDPEKCEVEFRLGEACMGDGRVTPEIAKRAGATEANEGKFIWQCGEVEWTEEWEAEYGKRQLEAQV